MMQPKIRFSLTHINGIIYVTGGIFQALNQPSKRLVTCEKYSIKENKWNAID